MKIADVLEKAAALIEPEGRWAQYWFAYDHVGDEVEPEDPEAVCWCARGAILAIEPQATSNTYQPFVDVLPPEVDEYARIELWNDAPERTHAEVVAKLREAAAKAREQGL